MPRVDPDTKAERKQQIKLLLEDNVKPARIIEITKLGKSTVYRYIAEIKAESDHREPPEDPTPENGKKGFKKPTGNGEDPKDQKAKEKAQQGKFNDDGILKDSTDKAAGKIATELSGIIQKDYMELIKSGAMYRGIEQELRESVEAMGYDWEAFVSTTLEDGYNQLLEDFVSKQDDISIEDVAAMRMAGKLEATDYSEEGKELEELEKYGR